MTLRQCFKTMVMKQLSPKHCLCLFACSQNSKTWRRVILWSIFPWKKLLWVVFKWNPFYLCLWGTSWIRHLVVLTHTLALSNRLCFLLIDPMASCVVAVFRGGTGVTVEQMLSIMRYILVHGQFMNCLVKISHLFAGKYPPCFHMTTRWMYLYLMFLSLCVRSGSCFFLLP